MEIDGVSINHCFLLVLFSWGNLIRKPKDSLISGMQQFEAIWVKTHCKHSSAV